MAANISAEQVHEIAKAAAKEAIAEWLLTLGIDPKEALETQKDFAHLRAWREATDTAKRAGIKAAITVLVTGFLGAVWLVIKGHQ